MTPALSLGPVENNQSYSTLTFESLYCSTAEKLYKRIKIGELLPSYPLTSIKLTNSSHFSNSFKYLSPPSWRCHMQWTHPVLQLPSHLPPSWEITWVSRPPGNWEWRLNLRQGNSGHSHGTALKTTWLCPMEPSLSQRHMTTFEPQLFPKSSEAWKH